MLTEAASDDAGLASLHITQYSLVELFLSDHLTCHLLEVMSLCLSAPLFDRERERECMRERERLSSH